MSRVLVIGYGNPLRCDDGLAWHVADDLLRRRLSEDLKIIVQHQLTPELAFTVSQAETVLFVDAAEDGLAGEIRCLPVVPLADGNTFSHGLLPGTILSLARDLYGKAPKALLLSLTGENFAHGEIFSRNVTESLPRLVTLIADLIQDALAPTGSPMEPVHG